MKSYCIFMIFACVLPKSSAYHISDSEAGRTTASTLVKEGLPAEIFCMVEGTGDYFWRKGESFDKSTLVASFTGDNANKDNEPYVVRVNGTLFIRNVTLKDEGKYFCRVTSVENECHGEVTVFVQASLRNFVLDIDACDNESSCLLYISPSQPISLTCTAYNAPPSMTLKWFNGSKEITEGIQQNEILPLNDNSRYITSTVTAVYGHPAFLTCQAVDPKRSNDDVRFAHAQIKMTVPFIETLPSWIFVAVTSAGCFIVFGIILLIKAMANRKWRKKYKTRKGEYVGLSADKLSMQEKKDKEISELKVEKDGVISGLEISMQAEKDKALSDLKISMQAEKDKALSDLKKEKHEEISRLKISMQAEKDKALSDLKKEKNEEISRLKREKRILNLEKSVKN